MNLILSRQNKTALIKTATSLVAGFFVVWLSIHFLESQYSFLREIRQRFDILGIFILILVPFVVAGLAKARIWGWHLFIFFSAFLAMYSVYQLQFFIGTQTFYHIILLNILNVVLVSFFVSESLRAPYLSAEERGWRISKRIPIVLPVTLTVSMSEIKNIEAKTIDISKTGALVEVKENDITEGSEVSVRVQITDSDYLYLSGEIIRRYESGNFHKVGIRFSQNDKEEINKLQRVLHERYTNRYGHRLNLTLAKSDISNIASSYNISRNGCFAETDELTYNKGDKLFVYIHYGKNQNICRPGRVVWVNHQPKNIGKSRGYGIQFTDSIYLHPRFALYYFFTARKSPLVR